MCRHRLHGRSEVVVRRMVVTQDTTLELHDTDLPQHHDDDLHDSDPPDEAQDQVSTTLPFMLAMTLVNSTVCMGDY